jgi:hypothetical protein
VNEYTLDDARPEAIHQLVTLGRSGAMTKANLEVGQSCLLNGTRAALFVSKDKMSNGRR